MKVRWTKFALTSLHDIYTYYKTNVSIETAVRIRYSILKSTLQLEKFPLSGAFEQNLEELLQGHRFLIRGN